MQLVRPELLQEFSNGIRFTVRVKARSRETGLIIERDGTVILHVVAAPERGKANKEIIKWFAEKFKISGSQVRLVAGLHSRTKVIEIVNINKADVAKALGLSGSCSLE